MHHGIGHMVREEKGWEVGQTSVSPSGSDMTTPPPPGSDITTPCLPIWLRHHHPHPHLAKTSPPPPGADITSPHLGQTSLPLPPHLAQTSPPPPGADITSPPPGSDITTPCLPIWLRYHHPYPTVRAPRPMRRRAVRILLECNLNILYLSFHNYCLNFSFYLIAKNGYTTYY